MGEEISFELTTLVYFFVSQAFSVVFHNAIEKAKAAEDVNERVANLIDCITYSVFIYTTRGLFEKDKLIFVSQMAFQVSKFQHILSKQSSETINYLPN